MQLDPIQDRNRRSWNAATQAHNRHKLDQASYLRDGGSTLFADELELLGDVSGRRVLHLQCNSGQDTLSLAALGASVTGVDFCDEAVAFAKTLSAEAGIGATFVQAEVCAWMEDVAGFESFDVAFATYGAIGWIADLPRWMRGVAGVLSPGGALVLLEFHPIAWSFNGEGRVIDGYFLDQPIEEEGGVSDYVARSGDGLVPMQRAAVAEAFENPHACVSYQWTVAQIVTAAAGAGLVVEELREYPHTNGCQLFEGMRRLPGRRFAMPEGVPDMPLMLGMRARCGRRAEPASRES